MSRRAGQLGEIPVAQAEISASGPPPARRLILTQRKLKRAGLRHINRP